MVYSTAFTLLLLFSISSATQKYNYEPTWESLDSRPLPAWYDEAKIGIFIHWGVFSVPSFRSEWFWFYWKEKRYNDVVNFMKENYPPEFSYQEFAHSFKAEFFNPDQWAELFKASGARYVVLTTKHHEGFTLWPSKTSYNWNAVALGPKRDIVGDLADAVRRRGGLRFGVYHSLYEWYNPLWIRDKESNLSCNTFATQKATPEMYELVNKYAPDVFWSDGEAEASDLYWGSKDFLTWLYNLSPVRDEVVVNDRWGTNTSCQHGGFFNCADRFSPGTLQPHKWENALTIDKASWGYRRNANLSDYMTIEEILSEVVQTISCGGNILINIGPTKEGIITPIFEERLRQLGEWLSINGEAIYETKPWVFQNDTISSNVWYVQRSNYLYGLVIGWPMNNTLPLESVQLTMDSTVQLLSHSQNLTFKTTNNQTFIYFPPQNEVKSKWVYVLRFQKVSI